VYHALMPSLLTLTDSGESPRDATDVVAERGEASVQRSSLPMPVSRRGGSWSHGFPARTPVTKALRGWLYARPTEREEP
jgi:hypothetical protein